MNVLILGGGAQGKACLYDICQNKKIRFIRIVDNDSEQIESFVKKLRDKRVKILNIDSNNKDEMMKLFTGEDVDIIIDLLPASFRKQITGWAIEAKKNIVNTSYSSNIKMHKENAKKAEIIVMPEAGLDPGIDLILAGEAIKRFDVIESFESNCGGIPVKEACTNPLNYKISWNFKGVLSSYMRPASIIVDGIRVGIPGNKLFEHGEKIKIKGVGELDRYPDGYSTTYTRMLGIRDNIKNMGRYALRWPGHCDFWKKIVELGLLDEESSDGSNPREILAKMLAPNLQYDKDEQDMVILRNEIIGIKGGKKKMLVQQLIDKRDKKTGLMAMNRMVGFTISIIAQMILKDQIKGKGFLNPAKDVPYDEFIKELLKRGIVIDEWEEIDYMNKKMFGVKTFK